MSEDVRKIWNVVINLCAIAFIFNMGIGIDRAAHTTGMSLRNVAHKVPCPKMASVAGATLGLAAIVEIFRMKKGAKGQ